MKIGIFLHGNMRTFLMTGPSGKRLCDAFMDYIVTPNNADVFAFTDSNDFFHDGAQYFVGNQIDVLHDDPSRLYEKIILVDDTDAQAIVREQLEKAIGSSLKSLVVESPYNAVSDPMFQPLYEANLIGCSPVRAIHQWRKVKLAYELLKSNGYYDIIVKWRFDLACSGELKVSSYDFSLTDVFVPCIVPPLVTDWFAIGTYDAMECYASVYDNLGIAIGDTKAPAEYSLASEYILFRLFESHGVRAHTAGYEAAPCRYMGYSYGKTTEELEKDIILKIEAMQLDATIVSHSSSSRDPKILRTSNERL